MGEKKGAGRKKNDRNRSLIKVFPLAWLCICIALFFSPRPTPHETTSRRRPKTTLEKKKIYNSIVGPFFYLHLLPRLPPLIAKTEPSILAQPQNSKRAASAKTARLKRETVNTPASALKNKKRKRPKEQPETAKKRKCFFFLLSPSFPLFFLSDLV